MLIIAFNQAIFEGDNTACIIGHIQLVCHHHHRNALILIDGS